MRFLLRFLACYLLLTASLSLSLLLSFEQVVQASESAIALSSPHFHRVRGDDKRLSATLTTWQEVDLAYERLFPYDRARQPHPPAGCVVLPVVSHHSVTKVLMLQCREHINLLRPAQWVSNRLYQQNRQGYLLLSIPEMGIQDVQVHMVAVRSSSFNPAILDVKSASSRPVIGLFIRHTMNVKQYTFKDTMTGKIDRIKATPNHPFYVINQHRYIPVSHLSPHDKLVNLLGHPVTLMCPWGKSSHCGHPYHPGQVIPVYNLEVYGQHRYFVGEPGILVHNVYRCKVCKETFEYKRRFDRHNKIFHMDDRPYVCETCEATFKDPDTLRRHQRRHTGKKPYECKYCDKAFGRSDVLKKHYNTPKHKRSVAFWKTFDTLIDSADTPSVASDPSEVGVPVTRDRSRSRSPLGFNIPSSMLPPEDDIDIPPLTPLIPEFTDSIRFENIVKPTDP